MWNANSQCSLLLDTQKFSKHLKPFVNFNSVVVKVSLCYASSLLAYVESGIASEAPRGEFIFTLEHNITMLLDERYVTRTKFMFKLYGRINRKFPSNYKYSCATITTLVSYKLKEKFVSWIHDGSYERSAPHAHVFHKQDRTKI